MAIPRHLTEATLADLAADSRAPTAPEQRHLDRCPSCVRVLDAERRLVQALRRPGRAAAPAQLVAGALDLFTRRRRRDPVAAVSMAVVRADAGMTSSLALRGAAASTARRLFAAGSLEVDVELSREEGEASHIIGQVQGSEGAVSGLPVHLRHDGPPLMAITGVRGEFEFADVRGEAVHLLLETEDGLHHLALGPPAGGDM